MDTSGAPHFPENLPLGWRELLKGEAEKDYFKTLVRFLSEEYRQKKTIYPARENILRALQAVDYNDVKVVILGQDPYPGKNHAIGLCFGVPNDHFPKPPSLLNIFKEIESDLQVKPNKNESDLTGWTQQGVLLLNTVMTVRAGQPFSHRDKGWEQFTDFIINLLNERSDPIVFLLWGAAAHKKISLINDKNHFILKAVHPSPLSASRGFFGCRHFSKANDLLKNKLSRDPIHWQQVSAPMAAKAKSVL